MLHLKGAPLRLSLPFGVLICKFFSGLGVVAYENEETLYPAMKISKRTMGQSISHGKHQAQPTAPNEAEEEEVQAEFEGEPSFSTRSSNLENTIYDQATHIEKLELRIDGGFHQLHQLVNDRFQQVTTGCTCDLCYVLVDLS